MAVELLLQPVFGQRLEQLAGDRLHPLEVGGKCTVEAVVLGLVLDQGGARQVVEIVERKNRHVLRQRLQQHQKLGKRCLDARLANGEEKSEEHGTWPSGAMGE